MNIREIRVFLIREIRVPDSRVIRVKINSINSRNSCKIKS